MYRKIVSYFFLIIVGGIFSNYAQAQNGSVKLEKLWTLEGFDRPESIIPNSDATEFYVTSVNGSTSEEDGNGYISRISSDGKIIEKKWVVGLDAPKGFAVHDGKVYVTDINDLVVIDIAEKQIINRIPVPGAVFLNDVAVVNGNIFFSDSGAATLYRYTESEGLSKFLEGDVMNRINGLLENNGHLLVAVMAEGKLLSVDLDTKAMTVLGGGIINGDGIGILENGGYLITSYSGEIYHIKNENETVLLLDSKPDEIAQNDSYYIGNTLYVANMNPGTVTAWKVIQGAN